MPFDEAIRYQRFPPSSYCFIDNDEAPLDTVFAAIAKVRRKVCLLAAVGAFNLPGI